jgi:MoaA/NifB/PqqE/SkfB family radical SAM enzyme
MSWNPHQLHFEHIHLEISSKCALKCPRCPRTEHPETPWLNKQLSTLDIQKMLPEWILRDQVQRITICGDVGDPIYNSEFHQIISYLKNANPNIHLYIITNGSYRNREWWKSTCEVLNEKDTVAFSIDGYDAESNQKYRIGSDWDSIAVGMDEVSKSKAFLVWATIVFQFNESHLDQIHSLAKTRGCDYLQITKSTKFGSNYARFNSETGVDPLQPSTKWISDTLRFERSYFHLSNRHIENSAFMSTMEENTAKNEETYLNAPVFPLCKTGNRGLYMNVTGQIFPCSWVSFPYKKTTSMKTGRSITFQESFFNRYAKNFNLLENDFQTVISNPLWTKIFNGFHDTRSCFIECEHKCRKEVMTPDYKTGWFLN